MHAPHTPSPSASSFKGIQTKGKTPEEIELEWLQTVYQGDDMPQLTFRAVGMGMLLGSLMSFSNLYVGLKTGWSLGVTITSCILSFAIFRVLNAAFGVREPSLLENNCMQSTASAAGASTGTTLISAFAAYLMITGNHPPMLLTMGLVFCLAVLGVFMAIPMKRNMINIEQLAFPTGTASAETLKSLHSEGGEASYKARSLFASMAMGGSLNFIRDGLGWIPGFLPLTQWFTRLNMPGMATLTNPTGYGFAAELSTIMVAAGAIMGLRVAASMALGAVICYGVLAPIMHGVPVGPGETKMVIDELGYRNIVSWTVWPGVSLMVSSALLSFGLQWRTVVRSFASFGTILGKKAAVEDPLERIEVPASWFIVGMTLGTIGCIILNKYGFGIGYGHGLLAVAISFFLAIVACRATGETDTTPIGALGKITQLTYGALIPSNMTANLMTANITSSVASSAADLLTDLKSGYLLGANPRRQFLAQFAGTFAGTLVAVPAFYLLVPTPDVLGSERYPAPSAQVWAAVAKLLQNGIHSLHPSAVNAMIFGAVAGIVLTLLENFVPRVRPYLPSPTGLGLAFVIPAWNSFSMFLGAIIAYVLEKRKPQLADRYTVSVSSGFIAGESIMGIVVALLGATGIL